MTDYARKLEDLKKRRERVTEELSLLQDVEREELALRRDEEKLRELKRPKWLRKIMDR